MEKSFTRKEGHPLSRVKLCEKKVVAFAQAKAGLAHASSDYLILTKLTQLGQPKLVFTMYIGETFVQLGG